MPMLTWTDAKYSVRTHLIDAQHQKLFGLLNELYDAMQQGRGRKILGQVLDRLVDYTVYHFETEERLMREHAYPGEQEHRQQHRSLTDTAKDLKRRFAAGEVQVTSDTLRFLANWLNGHIGTVDRKLGAFLHERGVQ